MQERALSDHCLIRLETLQARVTSNTRPFHSPLSPLIVSLFPQLQAIAVPFHFLVGGIFGTRIQILERWNEANNGDAMGA